MYKCEEKEQIVLRYLQIVVFLELELVFSGR